jgi:predicted extracellular nuclease
MLLCFTSIDIWLTFCLLWHLVGTASRNLRLADMVSAFLSLTVAAFIGVDAATVPAKVRLFFSEYAEGSSNNKYLEIYNAGTEPANLGDWAFPFVSNAPTTPGVYEFWNSFTAGAVLEPGKVYVIAHGSADQKILVPVQRG